MNPSSLLNTLLKRPPVKKAPSRDDYQLIPHPTTRYLKSLAPSWKNKQIPKRQLKLTEKSLDHFADYPANQILIKFMADISRTPKRVLEVGCSTGYNSEIFRRAGIKVNYEGCDYSLAFIAVARKKYPKNNFKVSDATKLKYVSKEFDIVLSAGCINHVPNYQKSISEAGRVTKDYVIFHRTPILHLSKTLYTEKVSYQVKMMEIFFNEEELVNEFYKAGLRLIQVNSHQQFKLNFLDEPVFIKSYLCQKAK